MGSAREMRPCMHIASAVAFPLTLALDIAFEDTSHRTTSPISEQTCGLGANHKRIGPSYASLPSPRWGEEVLRCILVNMHATTFSCGGLSSGLQHLLYSNAETSHPTDRQNRSAHGTHARTSTHAYVRSIHRRPWKHVAFSRIGRTLFHPLAALLLGAHSLSLALPPSLAPSLHAAAVEIETKPAYSRLHSSPVSGCCKGWRRNREERIIAPNFDTMAGKQVPKFTLTGQKYDQSTFLGRCKTFSETTDPRTLLASTEEVRNLFHVPTP